MSWSFNPFTFELDRFAVTGAGGPNVAAIKIKKVVDSDFLTTPEITLPNTPLTDSEILTLNGLEIDNTNYSLALNVLTMITLELKIGDNIYINYLN